MPGMGISAGEKHAMRVFSLPTAQGRVNSPIPAQAATPSIPEKQEEERQVRQNLSGISTSSQGKATALHPAWLLWLGLSRELAGFAAPPYPAFPRNLISLLLGITSAETDWAFDRSSLTRD